MLFDPIEETFEQSFVTSYGKNNGLLIVLEFYTSLIIVKCTNSCLFSI